MFEAYAKKLATKVRSGFMGKPAGNPLQSYQAQKAPSGADAAKQFLGGLGKPKNITEDAEYQKLQAERGAAIKGQFDAARGRLGQQEGQVKEGITSGLERLQARVGAVGGSVEKARQKALTETGQEFAQQYGELTAQEAAAQAGLKGEDVQRRYESEQMNRQMDQQNKQFAAQFGLNVDQFNEMKNQFGQQMQFQYKELDENLKTNLLNAITAMKKAGVNAKNVSKLFEPLQALYGAGRVASFQPLADQGNKETADMRKKVYGIYA